MKQKALDYVARQKLAAQAGRKEEVQQIKGELSKDPDGPDAGWMHVRLDALLNEIKAFDKAQKAG